MPYGLAILGGPMALMAAGRLWFFKREGWW